MKIISFRIRDEQTQELFERYCKKAGLSKGEAFEQMVREYCKDCAAPDQHDDGEKRQNHKADFIARLLACFAEDGGELRKFNRYFYKNEKYLVYPYYRRLGENESKMVKVDGEQVKRLLSWAESGGQIPLIAICVVDRQETPILGFMQPKYIPQIPAAQGVRISWEHLFLREDNSTVYIHLRAPQDLDAIREITRKSLSDDMFNRLFGRKD